MAARSAMAWLIRELRRKIYDVGPEDLDSDVQYAGDTIRLKCIYYDLASTAVNPQSPRITIWDSAGTVKVSTATTAATATTGVQVYNYQIPTDGQEGTWRVQFQGSVSSLTSRYTEEFQVRITQRIWSDDELEDYLDRHSIYVGLDDRVFLKHNPGYTKYTCEYGDFEWVTIYDGTSGTSGEVIPTSSDLLKGIFTFSSAQNIDLYLEGESYNIHLAAAECLEELAGDPNRSWNWSRGAIRHQAIDPLILAQRYRAMYGSAKSAKLVRTY